MAGHHRSAEQCSALRMETPPTSKRAHLRRLVAEKNEWNESLSAEDQAKGFRGWHERGYLPHCDKAGLVQFITFRLWDSLPASRKVNGSISSLSRSGAMLRAPRRPPEREALLRVNSG